MALERYQAKRKFDRTPEPAGSPGSPGAEQLQFCVQRHHATRLHYDLRLQVGGVLKSWAVPKGPTLDASGKRLAMLVEDHPLEYGHFEGVIPKGNYGAGSVMLWDTGSYRLIGPATAEEQLARGDFKFHLSGRKLNGDFALVRLNKKSTGSKKGSGEEWLLIKKKDAFATPGWDPEEFAYSVLTRRTQQEIAEGIVDPAPAPAVPARHQPETHTLHGAHNAVFPSPGSSGISPMLAQIGKGDPPTGEDWVFEVKWDGVRALCYIDGGKATLVSRKHNVMDRQYPELSILPHHIEASQAILDGEIAALDERGIPSFEKLQKRITVSEAGTIAALTRTHPVVFFAFDLLYLDGYDLRGVPLLERKALLKKLLKTSETIRYSEHFPGPGQDLLEAVREQGIEGILAKRASGTYESGRSADWLKFKVQSSDSFLLCGFTQGERDLFGALVLGIYDSGRLKWAGNVGTGFDRKTMRAIHEKLLPLSTPSCPLEPDKNLPKPGTVTWIRPELVCEVRFANWTSEGHLRAPVWLGFRPDIDPADCVREPEGYQPKPPLLASSVNETSLLIDGHRLKFTNLPKVFYPREGYQKRDLLNYYDAVAPLLLPHLENRPLSLKRYPNGIDHDFFFQKEVADSFPKWLRTGMADGVRHVIGHDRATLLFLVNLGCIDHNPWMSRMGSLDSPDYLLIDLDPQECGYDQIVEAAVLIRGLLDKAELESYPKTTGGDGMHLFVPLAPGYTYDQVRSFAEALAAIAAHRRPDLFTTPRQVSKRAKGRVYFDWAQIAKGKTISAPYVLRAYPGAPVATPLRWNEVTPRLRPENFNIRNALSRFDRVGDLFSPVLNQRQKLEKGVELLSAGL